MLYNDDVKVAKRLLESLHTHWDGKTSVLEMKDADYNWRQMEWWGFYFELLCQRKLAGAFSIQGTIK